MKFTAYKNTKVVKHQNEALNEALENKIKLIISKRPKITQKEIADLLNISRATIQRAIKTMLEQGTIKRIGSKRSDYWETIVN